MVEHLNTDDIAVMAAVIFLGAAMLIAMMYDKQEIAMIIVSGLLGYIGRSAKPTQKNDKDKEG